MAEARASTLVLSQPDVRSLLSMPLVLRALETALAKPYRMPPKVYVEVPEFSGDFRAMPAAQGNYASLKWVNVHPHNRGTSHPTVMAVILLNDARTGFPLCVMEGTLVTAFRTGAMAGLASKYLARKNSRSLGLVGAGVQARTQLLAHHALFGLESVLVFDAVPAAAQAFAKGMAKETGLSVRVVPSVREVVENADILSTITPAREPIVKTDWVPDGQHINGVGADAAGKQEFEPSLFSRARVVVDNVEQAAHSGEINVAVSTRRYSEKQIYATLEEIIRKAKPAPRKSARDVTLFVSTGLAIQDLATARALYELAKKKRKGAHAVFA